MHKLDHSEPFGTGLGKIDLEDGELISRAIAHKTSFVDFDHFRKIVAGKPKTSGG